MLRRDATLDERNAFVRTTWERCLTPKNLSDPPHGGPEMVRAGAAWLLPHVWAMGRRHIVHQILARPTVRVEMVDVEGEPMAWVAWEYEHDPGRTLVHFVFTVPSVRRSGFGRALLAPLLEQGQHGFSQMTKPGGELIRACIRTPR